MELTDYPCAASDIGKPTESSRDSSTITLKIRAPFCRCSRPTRWLPPSANRVSDDSALVSNQVLLWGLRVYVVIMLVIVAIYCRSRHASRARQRKNSSRKLKIRKSVAKLFVFFESAFEISTTSRQPKHPCALEVRHLAAGIFMCLRRRHRRQMVLCSLSSWSAPAQARKSCEIPFPATPEALPALSVDYRAHCPELSRREW